MEPRGTQLICLYRTLVSTLDCQSRSVEFDPHYRRHMKDEDLHLLAGLLEGEGSFLKSPPSGKNRISITCQMTDEDVIARVSKLLEVSYCKCSTVMAHYKPTYKTTVCGSKAYYLMVALKPLMGIRRQKQIDNALEHYKLKSPYTKTCSTSCGQQARYKINWGSIDLEQEIKIKSVVQIAEELGCSDVSVHKKLRKLGLK